LLNVQAAVAIIAVLGGASWALLIISFTDCVGVL
jgi:hypothetical protein